MTLTRFFNDNKWHLLSFFLFLFLSIFLTIGKIGTEFQRYALLTPDAGVYVSFVAAQENPQFFVNDPLLSSEENISDYRMFFYGQIKALRKIFDNYGSAAIALVPFGILIHLTGYYALGWAVFRRPGPAVLAALLLSSPMNLGFLRDFWGIILEPIPRFFYQGFLAFLLALSIGQGQNIKRWPIILAYAGLLNYFHPLSTPPITLGIMLSLWFLVKNETFFTKIKMMSLSVIILLVILLPFLQTFFSSTDIGAQSEIPYAVAAPIVVERLSPFALHPEQAMLSFISGFRGAGQTLWLALWGLAIAGLIAQHNRNAQEFYQFRAIWWIITGILVGAGLLPMMEHKIYSSLATFPLEFEMYRGMRYVVPLLLLLNLYLIWKYAEQKNLPQKFAVLGSILLLGVWGYYGILFQKSDIAQATRQNLKCFLKSQIVCSLPSNEKDFIDTMDALRNKTPIGARILSEGQEVAIRYYALRPLAYSYKDGPPFAYTDHHALMTWYKDYQTMNELAGLRKHSFRRKGFINKFVKFAYQIEADYLVLSEPYQPEKYNHPALIMIYSNDHYTIFKISKE